MALSYEEVVAEWALGKLDDRHGLARADVERVRFEAEADYTEGCPTCGPEVFKYIDVVINLNCTIPRGKYNTSSLYLQLPAELDMPALLRELDETRNEIEVAS